jgi:hypothetical protein
MKKKTKTHLIKRLVNRFRRSKRLRKAAWLSLVSSAVVVATFGFDGQVLQPQVYTYRAQDLPVRQSLKVDFTVQLAPHFNYYIEPVVQGDWREVSGLVGVKQLVFEPKDDFEPGQTYQVHLSNQRRAVGGAALPERTLAVATQRPAEILSVSPSPDEKNVVVDPTFLVRLADANRGLRRLVLRSSDIEFLSQPSVNDRTYSWKPSKQLEQGKSYEFTLEDLMIKDPAKRVLQHMSFTVVAEPRVVSATETDHFYPGQPLTLSFSEPMEPTLTRLQFDMPGSGRWIDAQTYVHEPGTLKPGTRYSYRVLQGSRSKSGGVFEAEQSFAVSTPGRVAVTSVSPGGGGVSVVSSIRFTFDQPVDKASAQSKFSLSPAATGQFSWSDNTMVYTPQLDYQTTYTATLASGITSIYGLDSNRTFSTSFTTGAQVHVLRVPLYRQQYVLSCEASALRMALAYRGIFESDFSILQRFGYSPRGRDTASNSWEDPNTGFVGDVSGVQNSTGYGTHAGPVAAAANSYGRPSSAVGSVSPGFIAAEVHADNPVIIWGWNKTAVLDSWNVAGVGIVQAWQGEHTRVVVGVVGRPSDPIGFYINDPATGLQYYWTTAQLLANMNIFGPVSNQAVVVR